MALYDHSAEVKALNTILTPSSKWARKLFAACSADHFHHPMCKAVYHRINEMVKLSGGKHLPSLDFVVSDEEIPDSARSNFLESVERFPAVQTVGDYTILLKILNEKAKSRNLVRATSEAAEKMIESDNPGEEYEKIRDRLNDKLFKGEFDDSLGVEITIGAGYDQAAEDSFRRIAEGKHAENLLKTGFKEFDERTGGFARTNLVILSANSGGGKSMMAINLMIRQYLLGYSVCLASFEMNEDEVNLRLQAAISELDMNRIQTNRLEPHEKLHLQRAWREFILFGAKRNIVFKIICPRRACSVEDIKNRVKEYDVPIDVLVFDYVNLLKKSADDDAAQWQELGDITATAKETANELNCVCYLLAQLSDNYGLRYSKGIIDHANFWWGWVRDEQALNDRILTIRQLKVRNAPRYDFQLYERFDLCQFRDPDQVDRTDWPIGDDFDSLMAEYRELKLIETSAPEEEDIEDLVSPGVKVVEVIPPTVVSLPLPAPSQQAVVGPAQKKSLADKLKLAEQNEMDESAFEVLTISADSKPLNLSRKKDDSI